MQTIGLRTSIWNNRLRLVYLTSLLPIVVVLGVAIFLYFVHGNINEVFINEFITINSILGPVLLIWLFVGVLLQKQIIFSFTGAKEITRKENPEIYNIVENLCISRGLVTPKIGIINDSSMNAFATGWSPKNSWVVFSTGLLERLNKKEIEAVAGHELTHIINGDVKNMVIINVFIGAIGTIGYILMKSGSSSSKKQNPLPILGAILYVLSILILPLINFAISRKKEFLADAGSVDLTKDSASMISALEKISTDSIIESVHGRSKTVSSMFISDPKNKSNLFSDTKSWFSTHPSIEDRIKALKMY